MTIKDIESIFTILPERFKSIPLIGIHNESSQVHFQIFPNDFDLHFPMTENEERLCLSSDYPFIKQFKFDNIVFFALYQN